jgi:hypothetical protein
MRIIYFPYQIPFELDGLTYFSYAYELSQSGHFPVNYDLANNGWSIFLSVFFFIFNFDNFTQYIFLVRLVSASISIATFIPLYFLYRRFFARDFALVGASIFILDGRIIGNSLLGITEPLFIFLIILAMVFFLKKDNYVYLTFMIIGFAAIIRYEGILLVIPISVIFFKKNKFLRKSILRYLGCLLIIVLVLTPVIFVRIETMGKDGIISHVVAGINSIYLFKLADLSEEQKLKMNISDEAFKEKESFPSFFGRTITSLIKFNFLLLTPYLLVVVLGGFIFIIRNRACINFDYKILTVVLVTIAMLFPAFYAYGRGIDEIRYLFALIPLFTICALYFIKQIDHRFGKRILILSVIICVAISSSILMLEINKKDYANELETFHVTQEVMNIAEIINTPSMEGNYITTAKVLENWPKIKSPEEVKTTKISTDGFDRLEYFIQYAKQYGLTHIVVDDKGSAPEFILSVFYNEEDYPYLKKVYDSKGLGYSYHVKVFEINYTLFNELFNTNNN